MFAAHERLGSTEIVIQKNYTSMTYIFSSSDYNKESPKPICGSDSHVSYMFDDRRNAEPIIEDLPKISFQCNWTQLVRKPLSLEIYHQ